MTAVKRFAMAHWVFGVWCLILGLVVGVGTSIIIGRTQIPKVLAFGGNGDNCAVQFIDQLNATGRSSGYNVIPVCYDANTGHMAASGEDGKNQGLVIWNEQCAGGCGIWGFSNGTEAAIRLAAAVGLPSDKLMLFGGPQHAAGIWHHWGVVSGFPPFQVSFWLDVSGFPTGTMAPAGAKVFFNAGDPFADAAPQCGNPAALGGLNGNAHAVPPQGSGRVWVDRFGLEIHEFGSLPTVASGADPSPIWQGCPWFDWNRSEEFDGTNGLPGMFPPFPPGTQAPGQLPIPMPGR